MPTAHDLAADILAKRTERYEAKRKTTRQDHPRASSIGRCARQIYHSIVDWESKPQPDQHLSERFQRGRDVEQIVTGWLYANDYTVIHGQMPFEIKEKWVYVDDGRHTPGPGFIIICTGHIDGRIEWNGIQPVFDCKSLHPNVWDRVNDARDFLRMGSFWTHYPRQLLLYMYAHSEEYGLFIIDDCLGHWKILPMVLSEWLPECEEALQTARAAAIAALTNDPPPQIEDMSVCRQCWAHSVGLCMPAMAAPTEGLQLLDDPDLVEGLERMEQLHDTAKEYESLADGIKRRFKGTDGERLAGDWIVRTKKGSRKAFTASACDTYTTTWERVGK